ncbi:MAG: BREX-1 system phosphatase PglZ type A [Clostridia bacterium]|nr:BREX-1 system phosphatase PglZ type A [Clostridia bacterium]
MSIESIKNSLIERFQKPLEEYYTRRIVFWEDAAGAFASEVDGLEIEGVKILKLTGKNYFTAKKILLHDDKDSNYLVYDPCCYPNEEEDYLYSVKRYSGEIFFADKLSMQMEEFGIAATPEMRDVVKLYARFFDNKERTDKLKALGKRFEKENDLHIGILCALCSVSAISMQEVIIAVLMKGADDASNKLLEQIEKFGSISVFWDLVQKATGFTVSQNGDNLKQLMAHVLFSAASECLQVNLSRFEQYISPKHAAFCHGLIHEMVENREQQQVTALLEEVETNFRVEEVLAQEDISKIAECDVLLCINKIILKHYFTEIKNNIIKAEEITKTVEKRKPFPWFSEVESYFEGLLECAHMQFAYQKWADGFHEVDPKDVWELYRYDYYQMDTYYRRFHLAFSKSLKASVIDVEDDFKSVAEVIEQFYQNWFLKELSTMWMNAADEFLLESRSADIPKQTDFYIDHIKYEKENQTVFVVISDALRFEVAAELREMLELNHRGKTRLDCMKAVFPSVTSFGMAALLPGQKTVAENGDIMVGALPCKTTGQRKAVLQKEDENSTAITYKDFVSMKKDDRNAFITGNKVIYIYHNTIDAIGDKAPTETKVFEACEEAVSELQNLVKMITGLRSSAKVIITADHGFLYTYFPLPESQKISTSTMEGVLQSGRRFVIGTASTDCEFLQPVQMEINRTDKSLLGYAPRGTIRIKQAGGGENYVHGGTSLQEMCVPVLSFKSVRLDSKQFQKNSGAYYALPVEIESLSTSKRITNLIFTIHFLQSQPVSNNRKAATFELYFVDEYNNKVSDMQRIVADKTSPEAPDRQFRCRFNLKSQKYEKTKPYYLVAIDENCNEVLREEYTIDIPFAVDDFGFFA